MIFYLAGSAFHANPYVKYRLLSYHSRPLNDAQRCRKRGEEVFLDSGAYSAHSQGVEIDIEKYAAFILESGDVFNPIANLDCIPGKGVSPACAAERSYLNLRKLEDLGCSVVPTFHMGEPVLYLERYVDEYQYIALGGMDKAHPDKLRSWLDWCWYNYLTDADGKPKVKVHGFGLSSYWAATRYPWHSMDALTWIIDSLMAMKARVWLDGKPKVINLRHERLPEEVENRFGITTQHCIDDYASRLIVNAAYYRELENHTPPCLVVPTYLNGNQRNQR